MNESLCFGGRPVRWFGLGSGRDDVSAVKVAVGNANIDVATIVSRCKDKLDPNTRGGWDDLSRRATAFVATDVPLLTGIDEMYSQGKSLINEINTWKSTIGAICSAAPSAQPAQPAAKAPVNQTYTPPTHQAAAPAQPAYVPPAAAPPTPSPDSGSELSPWAKAGIAVGAVVLVGGVVVALTAPPPRAA
ncbi:MAG TPA: hypothetical protein VIX35_00865 [Vicinamibacterales bacterium]